MGAFLTFCLLPIAFCAVGLLLCMLADAVTTWSSRRRQAAMPAQPSARPTPHDPAAPRRPPFADAA